MDPMSGQGNLQPMMPSGGRMDPLRPGYGRGRKVPLLHLHRLSMRYAP